MHRKKADLTYDTMFAEEMAMPLDALYTNIYHIDGLLFPII